MVTDRKQSVLLMISAFSYLPIFHIPLATGQQTAQITLQRLCSEWTEEIQQLMHGDQNHKY